ncbi:hypothetical protein M3J09_001213 [Ascochyta lentis]
MARSSTSSLDMQYQHYVPAKCISNPNSLLRAMEKLAGPGRYHIEMRRNVYNIMLHEDINVRDIVHQSWYR